MCEPLTEVACRWTIICMHFFTNKMQTFTVIILFLPDVAVIHLFNNKYVDPSRLSQSGGYEAFPSFNRLSIWWGNISG